MDKAHEGDSPDAVRCDSKLIFMGEISGGPRASERRGVGVLRAVRHRDGALCVVVRRATTGARWTRCSGSPAPARLGAICPKNLATGTRCIGNTVAGRPAGLWDLMLEALAEGGGSDAVQMVDSTVIRAHHCAAGARGDSKPGSWPLARWLLDQNPRPDQR